MKSFEKIKKKKKINSETIIAIIIAILYLSLKITPILYEEGVINNDEGNSINDYARITDVEYKAEVLDTPEDGGKVLITEKLTYDIHAASKNNLFWELWRDLPEDYVDGLKVNYKVNYVKEIKDNGAEIAYYESPRLYNWDYEYRTYPHRWYHSPGPYNESAERYECVFFYINGVYRDKVQIEVQYIMNNGALKYSDVSELYLTMYSEETIKYLKSYKADILLKQSDMPKEGNYIAHTFGTKNNTFEYTESDTKYPGYHTFSIDLDEKDLKFNLENRYIEFSLLSFNEDKHIFTDYAPNNFYSNDVYLEEAKADLKRYDNIPKRTIIIKTLLFIISITSSGLIIYSMIKRNKEIKEKNIFYTPGNKMEYFRDIPSDLDPFFATNLAFAKTNKRIDLGNIYAAILLSLVRKGYIDVIKINEKDSWTDDNTLIKVLYKQKDNTNNISYDIYGKKLEPLTSNENDYLNLILKFKASNNDDNNEKSDNSITMSDFQSLLSDNADETNKFFTKFEDSIFNIGIDKGYTQKYECASIKNKTNSISKRHIIIGVIILIIALFLIKTRIEYAYGGLFILSITLLSTGIYAKKIAKNHLLLTQKGEDECAEWYALYNFLNNMTLMNERTIVELPLWEKYLVYATAFGISEKVIKVLEVQCPNFKESKLLNNNYFTSYNFRTTSHNFHRATTHAVSITHGGFGHGYGGGGRGGGGGGGGH